MKRWISAQEILTNHPELESILGYSEELLEELVKNGDLAGKFHKETGELLVDSYVMDDLVKITENIMSSPEREDWD